MHKKSILSSIIYSRKAFLTAIFLSWLNAGLCNELNELCASTVNAPTASESITSESILSRHNLDAFDAPEFSSLALRNFTVMKMAPGRSALQSEIRLVQRKELLPSLTEKIYANGRRVTRVSGRIISYCVIYDSVGSSFGRDMIKDGLKPKITRCGNLFD